jgi:hypothetical protein
VPGTFFWTWYLRGARKEIPIHDFVELNVFKLEMMATIQRAPFRFGWGSYFSWPAEQVSPAIRKAADLASLLVWYRPLGRSMHRAGTLNRHAGRARAAARDPANGFILWRRIEAEDATFEIELYRNKDNRGAVAFTTTLKPGAKFDRRIRVDEIAVGGGWISVRCVCLTRIDRDYNLLIHATDTTRPEAGFESWDRVIKPPTTTWRPGDRFNLEYRLAGARAGVEYRLVVGFVEEVVRGRRWRRMPRSDAAGGDSMTLVVTPAADVSEVPSP